MIDTIKKFTLILAVLLSLEGFAQDEFKFLQKKIPVKGIKSIEQVYSNYLFKYYAKQDTGLYDIQSNKIIFHHLEKFERSHYHKNWFEYETKDEYGIFNLSTSKSLIRSRRPYWLHYSEDSNLVNVIGAEIYGLLDRSRNAAYVSMEGFFKDSLFFSGNFDESSCELKSGIISYGYGNFDGVENYYKVTPLSNFVRAGSNIFSKTTGELVLNSEGEFREWNDLIERATYRGRTFYDLHLNEIIVETGYDEFTVEDFKFLLDSNITDVEYIGNRSIYLCQIEGKYQFYSIQNWKSDSPKYDHVFPMAYDYIHNGHSFYTVDEEIGFGLYNTWRGEEIRAINAVIEKRAFLDGTYWYRANNKLSEARNFKSDSIVTKDLSAELIKNSTIISHLGVYGGNLIVSPRATSADTHDSYYYTATNFDGGAGVINLIDKSWRIKPRFHSITPFKAHFIAMKIGSTYHNASWLQTILFDKNFQPITDLELGASFIFMEKLFIIKHGKLVEYDLEKNEVARSLGEMRRIDADFMVMDGYFMIGNNNYRKGETAAINMDITDIITPKCELLKIPTKDRFRYMNYLGDGLMIIGRIEKNEPTDREIHSLEVDRYAIVDLRSEKMLTSWCDYIYLDYTGESIEYHRNEADEIETIPIGRIRERFSK